MALVLFNELGRSGLFRGLGYISTSTPDALVTVNTAPAARLVELRHRITRRVVEVKFSAPDGTVRFDGVDPAEVFDLIGRDWTEMYNDVIVSRVTPEPYV